MSPSIAPHKPQKQDIVAPVFILGVESSCDETAASVLRRDPDGSTHILSSIIASQDEYHAKFGGVVPEIAARAHMSIIDAIIDQAVTEAGVDYSDLSAVAATSGPGLIGGVITGLLAAKGLCLSLDIPLIAVNHLEGHALSPRLSGPCAFPYLLLLVSGGHTQLLSVKGLGDYERLGSTVDDAAGEAFDKTAKVMGLGFPGGPNVERVAAGGDPKSVKLPRPYWGQDHANFSFAGLKTAVARAWRSSDKSEQDAANVAASFQATVCEVLSERTGRAMDMFTKDIMSTNEVEPSDTPHRFVVAGGVAANKAIRGALEHLCEAKGFSLNAPPMVYCTDNAAMIALAGLEHFIQGNISDLSAKARPRWPLDSAAAKSDPASGSGKKGPKS
ncbi:tRNA (adenosine(37)-N6)-threonylcarbamoyltransferase complex transferase subunit TsaD [Fretibacter rubidus]|uniref:tRNA (adenosine(37)-N6)-threonylcarbamoyltransferase complex transferase subunit TsaD n=1 Tax=Fretibacter rubidus TaxID=570162 RepID=UPI00352ACFA6